MDFEDVWHKVCAINPRLQPGTKVEITEENFRKILYFASMFGAAINRNYSFNWGRNMWKTTDPGMDYSMGTANKDHKTGIHYGVISQHEIAGDAINDITMNGTDLGYEGFIEQLQEELKSAINRVLEDYTGAEVIDDDVSNLLEGLDLDYQGEGGPWEYSDGEVSLTLGTDGDLFITRSEYFTKCQYCSPCAPGAGYLVNSCEDGIKTYCLGHDWFEDGAPYPVFRVSDGELVEHGKQG